MDIVGDNREVRLTELQYLAQALKAICSHREGLK
jgi:hypothetical protein